MRAMVAPLALSVLTLCGVLASVAARGADLPACPATIETSQDVKNAPAGWTAGPASGTQRFARLTLKAAGDPGELRPDDEKTVAGKFVQTWEVKGLPGLTQVCEYSGTQATVTRPIVGAVGTCVVTLQSGKPGAAVLSATCR